MRIFYLLLVVLLVSLNGCENLITDYKVTTDPDFLKEVTLLEYIEEGNDPSLSLYANIISYSDMEEMISKGNQTRIIPTNEAISIMLSTIGAENITDVPKNVWRDMFSYLVFEGEYRSIDLHPDETKSFITPMSDSIYITRNIAGSDKYRLYVNRTSKISMNPILVTSQDYLFKDGVAHIVNEMPRYRPPIRDTDSPPESVDYSLAETDTVWTYEDTNVSKGYKNSNYDGKTHYLQPSSTYMRYTFFKFDLPDIGFVDDLSSAHVNFYVYNINGTGYIPSCGIYSTDTSWDETTLTWNNMPPLEQELTIFNLGLEYNSGDVSSYIINSYYNSDSSVSFAMKSMNGESITGARVDIRNSEYSSQYAPFLTLIGGLPSELEITNHNPISISHNETMKLTKKNISMSPVSGATYNYGDHNIIYVIMEVPHNGTITSYGYPLKKFDQFTQAELNSGVVKYVHSGINSSNDSFQLKVKDYIGGIYDEYITMEVNVN